MKLRFKYFIITLGLLLQALIACNNEPPVNPDYPPVITCKVSGDVNVNYTSIKGFIGKNLQFKGKQLFFSSIAKINGEDYDILISLFFKDTIATAGIFPIRIPDFNDSLNDLHAWAAFSVGLEGNNRIEFWADTGLVTIEIMDLVSHPHRIKGSFDFIAYDSTKTKKIVVTDGYVDLKKNF